MRAFTMWHAGVDFNPIQTISTIYLGRQIAELRRLVDERTAQRASFDFYVYGDDPQATCVRCSERMRVNEEYDPGKGYHCADCMIEVGLKPLPRRLSWVVVDDLLTLENTSTKDQREKIREGGV
jgi:hypothetical protein